MAKRRCVITLALASVLSLFAIAVAHIPPGVPESGIINIEGEYKVPLSATPVTSVEDPFATLTDAVDDLTQDDAYVKATPEGKVALLTSLAERLTDEGIVTEFARGTGDSWVFSCADGGQYAILPR